MRPRQRPSSGLLELARLQDGVVSSEQILGHGLSLKSAARLVQEGAWQRMGTGLISTRAEPPSWRSWAWGGVLLGGDRARLGGRAAAHLWELVEQPDDITVLVPHDRKLPARRAWRFVRERPGLRLASRGSLPRTGVEDTVLDLCAEADEKDVISVVLAAVQQRLTRPERLARRLAQRGRVRHRQLIMDLLGDAAEGAETPLELAYLHDVERAHGLPPGDRQSRAGRNFLDVRYRAYATVVELDGRLGHEGMGRFRDMRRDNRAVVRGEVPLRYGWIDVRVRRCEIAWEVGAILAARGWDGIPTRCDNCQDVPLSTLWNFSS